MRKVIFCVMLLIVAASTFSQNTQIKKVAILEMVDKEDVVSYGVKLMVCSKLAYAITNTPGYEGNFIDDKMVGR